MVKWTCLLYFYIFQCVSAQNSSSAGEFSFFRSLSGVWNNLKVPDNGATGSRLLRYGSFRNWTAAASIISGIKLPTVREVSEKIFRSRKSVSVSSSHNLIVVHMIELLLLEFLDIVKEKEKSYVSIPTCDYYFDPNCSGNISVPYYRYNSQGKTTDGDPIFINNGSGYLIASFLYGRTTERQNMLRSFSRGQLNLSSNGLLPTVRGDSGLMEYWGENDKSPNFLFYAGDRRINRNIGMQALVTLFAREHNRRATNLSRKFPFWSDELIFQYSRRWVIDVWQNIIFNRIMPFILGSKLSEYNGYNETENPSVEVNFVAVASLFVETSLAGVTSFMSSESEEASIGPIPSSKTYYSTRILQKYGIESTIRGLIGSPAGRCDIIMNSEFAKPVFGELYDRPSLWLQNSRDLGALSFNDLRTIYNMSDAVSTYQCTSEIVTSVALAGVYSPNASNLDGCVGALAEETSELNFVGKLMIKIISDQIKRSRDSDRLYFLASTSFHDETEKNEIRARYLKNLIVENTKISSAPQSVYNVFDAKAIMMQNEPSLEIYGNDSYIFSCGFSINWNSTTDSISIDFCVSYPSGFFSLGFQKNASYAEYWILQASEMGIDAGAYEIEESSPIRLVPNKNQTSLIWQILTPSKSCPHRARFQRTFITTDPRGCNITADLGQNYTSILWAYNALIPSLNYYDPTKFGVATLVLLPVTKMANPTQKIEKSDTVALNLILFHGAFMFSSLGVLFPASVYVSLFWSPWSGWGQVVSFLDFIGTGFLIFGVISVYVSANGRFLYAHAYLGTIILVLAIFRALFGEINRSPLIPCPAKRCKIERIITGLTILTAVFTMVNNFLGIAITTEILPAMSSLYSILGAWLGFLFLAFISGKSLNNPKIKLKHNMVGLLRDKVLQFYKQKQLLADFSIKELNEHIKRGAAMCVFGGKICDLSHFFHNHPGGPEDLAAMAGVDITHIFEGKFGLGIESSTLKDVETENKLKPKIFSNLHKSQTQQTAMGSFLNVNLIRSDVIKRLKVPHSNVARLHAETGFVGELKCDAGDEAPEFSETWTPTFFPSNRALLQCALYPDQRKVVILCEKNEEYEKTDSQAGAYRFRFGFEHERHHVWFLPGQHVLLSLANEYGRTIIGKYTPSVCHAENYLDLHIKIGKKGAMANLLNKMQPGDLATMLGPIDSPVALIKQEFSDPGCAQHVALITAGSGITLCAQLMDYYLSFGPRDDDGMMISRIALLNFNPRESEVMMKDEIEELRKYSDGSIEIFHCLTRNDKWGGPIGHISKTLLENTVFKFLDLQKTSDGPFLEQNRISKKQVAVKSWNKSGCSSQERLQTLEEEDEPIDIPASLLIVICGPPDFQREAEQVVQQMKIGHATIAVL